jgi:hypothetical protein
MAAPRRSAGPSVSASAAIPASLLGVTTTSDAPNGSRSRLLIVTLIVAAVIVALLPVAIARTRRVQAMRVELGAALAECRARYASARTAADTAAADSVRPSFHGAQRPGDPACGPYRRRNMLR